MVSCPGHDAVRRRLLRCALAAGALLVSLAAPAAAGAHAQLEATTPTRGAALKRVPAQVVFRFSETVTSGLGAVRVFDGRGREVQTGSAFHPGDRGDELAVRLRPGLPDGGYTAVYRVVSADSHPVSGGVSFSAGTGGAGPQAVDRLLAGSEAGPVTSTALGAARAVQYAAIALALGALLLLVACWRPAIGRFVPPSTDGATASRADGELAGCADDRAAGWADGDAAPRFDVRGADTAFVHRVAALVAGAALAGALSGALGVVLEGAVAQGESVWAAARPDIVSAVLGTRFGLAWGGGVVAWLVLGGLAVVELSPGRRRPVTGWPRFPGHCAGNLDHPGGAERTGAHRRTDPPGAERTGAHRRTDPPGPGRAAGSPGTARPALAAGLLGLGWLCLLPALGGHAASTEPVWLALPANVLHVVAVSAWIGGLAALLVALRSATARLYPHERSPLLVAVVGRFSTVAGGAVAVVLITGTVQSLANVSAFGQLTSTAYGRAILIKVGLLLVLVGLGATQRLRVLPALRAAAGTPGRAGVLLRRVLRTELAVGVIVLGVTGALATYPPADVLAAGPVSRSATLGPARAELTVDPATVGTNEVHLYLFDRRTGAQWDVPRQVEVTASLASRGLDALPVDLRKAGPGHYVAPVTALPGAGRWRLRIAARVSAFDEYDTTITVPVR